MNSKKALISYFLILIIIGNLVSVFHIEQRTAGANTFSSLQVIPNEAIRLRILANSNSEADQQLKRQVRDEVKMLIDQWVMELTSIESARHTIRDGIPEIEKVVQQILNAHGATNTFTVQFNKNVEFPTKVYGNYVYPAGEYEAVLISIGEAKGNNWWCVLFPPLCFLDFANGDAVSPASQLPLSEANRSLAYAAVIELQPSSDGLRVLSTLEKHQIQVAYDTLLGKQEPKEEKDLQVRFFLFDLFSKK